MDASSPRRDARFLAYAISALTTLLWVACVLPAGVIASGAGPQGGDLATPMHRERAFLVPALVLLVVGPVGLVLSKRRAGLRSVLAATDAFIAGYAAVVLTVLGAFGYRTSAVLVGLLYAFTVLSVLESLRLARGAPRIVEPRWRGVRLALCVLVLLTPSLFFLASDRELASLLAPFALLAVSTGGAALARTLDGLRWTASLVHLALAIHVLLTLRYTLFEQASEGRPPFEALGVFGTSALVLSVVIVVLALAQVLRLGGRVYRARTDTAVADPTP